jgi:glycerol-3-phosphate acyltransferase PlsY
MTVLAWALIGYVAGSFPSAWLVALATGKRSVLDHVRRNIGEADAHVLLQESGGGGAAVAAALDLLKGLAPVLVAVRTGGAYDVAACAVGTVTGHCWPPILGRYAGRGLAAAAGAFLGFLPLEMALAGVVRVVGGTLRAGGLASTLGYVAIPVVAAARCSVARYSTRPARADRRRCRCEWASTSAGRSRISWRRPRTALPSRRSRRLRRIRRWASGRPCRA